MLPRELGKFLRIVEVCLMSKDNNVVKHLDLATKIIE